MQQPQYEPEFGHIIDVDGQLIGINASVVTAATLRKRAGLDNNRTISLVLDQMETQLSDGDVLALSVVDVLHFRSYPANRELFALAA